MRRRWCWCWSPCPSGWSGRSRRVPRVHGLPVAHVFRDLWRRKPGKPAGRLFKQASGISPCACRAASIRGAQTPPIDLIFVCLIDGPSPANNAVPAPALRQIALHDELAIRRRPYMDKAQPRKNPLRGSTLELAVLDSGNQAVRRARFTCERCDALYHPFHQANIQTDRPAARTNEYADKTVRPIMIIRVDRDGANTGDATGVSFLKNTCDLPRAAPRFVRTRQRTFLQPALRELLSQCRRNAAEYPSNLKNLCRSCFNASTRTRGEAWHPQPMRIDIHRSHQNAGLQPDGRFADQTRPGACCM